jgi:hypothetical protein
MLHIEKKVQECDARGDTMKYYSRAHTPSLKTSPHKKKNYTFIQPEKYKR